MVRRPKLTKDEVDRILQMLEQGKTKKEVAQAFGISTAPIYAILEGAHALSPFKQAKEERVSEYQRCASCGAKVLPPCMACTMTGRLPGKLVTFPKVMIPGDGRGYS